MLLLYTEVKSTKSVQTHTHTNTHTHSHTLFKNKGMRDLNFSEK